MSSRGARITNNALISIKISALNYMTPDSDNSNPIKVYLNDLGVE